MATYLDYLESILVEFDVKYAPLKGQLDCTFYDRLMPSIKLWINMVERQQLSWDKLVITTNIAEAKIHIYNNQHLNKRYSQGKQHLKLIFKKSWKQ